MTIYEILSFNKELLHRLSDAGVKTGDYRYVDLFRDFTKMVREGNKTTYAVAVLSDKYRISERKVYDVIGICRKTARTVQCKFCFKLCPVFSFIHLCSVIINIRYGNLQTDIFR